MRHVDRRVVLPLVAVSCVCSVLALMISASGPVMAAAERWLDKLGPTEGVILAGEPSVEVRAEGGRIAFSDEPGARLYSTGLININEVLPKIMNSERFTEAREELRAELQVRDQEYQERNRALQERYEGITRESPDFAEAMQAMETLNNEYQLFQREALGRINSLQAEQLERAYAEVVSAVEVVCEARGIDLVFRYIPVENEFSGETSADAMNEVRMRSLLRYPDGLDITDAILEEMALPLD